jgi:hypothetical protein
MPGRCAASQIAFVEKVQGRQGIFLQVDRIKALRQRGEVVVTVQTKTVQKASIRLNLIERVTLAGAVRIGHCSRDVVDYAPTALADKKWQGDDFPSQLPQAAGLMGKERPPAVPIDCSEEIGEGKREAAIVIVI